MTMSSKLEIWGGVREYGRACYYFSIKAYSFIIDCGINKKNGLMPNLDKEKLSQVQWFFLSHSHQDHALGFIKLIEQGYHIKMILTQATGYQLYEKYGEILHQYQHAFVYIDALIKPYESYQLDEDFIVSYGYNGHMIGSVWFYLNVCGKKIFYSGDYSGVSTILKYHSPDYVLKGEMNLAILDNGNSMNNDDWQACVQKISHKIMCILEQKNVILIPSNKYSKIIELIVALRNRYPNTIFYYDVELYVELYKGMKLFVNQKSELLALFSDVNNNKVFIETHINNIQGPAICFANSNFSRYKEWNRENIIFVSKLLALKEGANNHSEVEVFSMKSHQNTFEIKQLLQQHVFKYVILCHSESDKTTQSINYLKEEGMTNVLDSHVGDTIYF